MYSYRCFVILKFTVQRLAVNQTLSSQPYTVIGLVLSQASACELMLEEVTPPQFPLSLCQQHYVSNPHSLTHITHATHNRNS
jgi:hypothetical protein